LSNTQSQVPTGSLRERCEDFLKRIFFLIVRLAIHSPMREFPAETSIKAILVVRQHNQLGDMLCAVPLLRTLRNRFPDAWITLVTSRVNDAIMQHHPYINETLCYKQQPLTALWGFYRSLRKRGYDLAIVPASISLSSTSSFIALLSRATVRVGPQSFNGLKNPTSFCFTTPVTLDWTNKTRRHHALRNLDIVASFGIGTNDLTSVIGITTEERKTAAAFIKPLRLKYPLLVGFHPGAGKPPNRWHAKRFAAIANKLSREFNAGILITSGPMDEIPVQEMREHLQCPSILIQSGHIRSDAAIIDQLDLCITNDTGIMHVAGATRTQVLALFGPTDPLQWSPIGQKNHYIASKDEDINSITEEEVYDVAGIILNEIKRHRPA
jgi:ADP-heptose:LPS heptosyltransferase